MAVMPQFIDSQAVLWSRYLAIAATMAAPTLLRWRSAPRSPLGY